ncbi:ATP-binding cassette domain-containing protein [Acetobacteraceae bacterium KSS8]|uniref:ATP-binding cassette domain-containing protein n=1 Tax=Endosaccharibacter trunci TaxID=2812733 RepID=A0ABT1W769_9PROT|nr:ATP-binding cassette domain-containing protein [Acetobacteraceae bacterium KSS8]
MALRYPGRDPNRGAVLQRISADIPSGGFRWVLGASGAGKSSLLRLLSLSLKPTSGQLEVLGVSVNRARRAALARLRRRTGTVFQDLRLLGELSVFDNVALRLRLDGLPEDRIELEVTEMLRFVGLGRKLDVRPHSLSGGEQQRVAVARAVVHRPPLLLADEPTGALDEKQAIRLISLFEELNQMGSTVLVATHNEALVRRFGHPALVLERGRLVSHG